MMPTVALSELLRYRRPEGSMTQRIFCEKFLEPVMGLPDEFGNYLHTIYNKDGSFPNLCFTAHHDTVHNAEGIQALTFNQMIVTTTNSNCLGADCTTGVWLILGMIEYNVPGHYVIHAGEEIGCVGSSALVKSNPDWLKKIDAVISFDRKGCTSIITHQLGTRTASENFAHSFSRALNMPDLQPDSTGAYTDSNEYAHVVSECTNISVGYYGQHTKAESQDMDFAYNLLEALVSADWDELVFERDASLYEVETWGLDYKGYGGGFKGKYDKSNFTDILELLMDYPEEVANVLDHWGCDAEYLYDQVKEICYSSRPNSQYN